MATLVPWLRINLITTSIIAIVSGGIFSLLPGAAKIIIRSPEPNAEVVDCAAVLGARHPECCDCWLPGAGGMLTFEPDPAHYHTCGLLNSCCDGVGSVHLARHLPSGTLVAIKKFNMERAQDEAALIQHEVRLARQLRHPHVLGLHTAFVAGPHVLAVLPLMGFGSCRDLLAVHFPAGLPEPAAAALLHDTLQALDYLHRRGIVHRAVRASHILVSASGRACLSGLRYSCQLLEAGRWQRSLHSFPGSTACNLSWLSPELLEQNLRGYNEKSDVYSVGVTACELANGLVPFAGLPTTLMLTEKVRGCVPQLLDCSTAPPPAPTLPSDADSCGGGLLGPDSGSACPLSHLVHTDHPPVRRTTGVLVPDGLRPCAADSDDSLQTDEPGLTMGGGGSLDAVAPSEGPALPAVYSQRRFSEAFHQFTELCLQRDPALRPGAGQLLLHPFVKQAGRGCGCRAGGGAAGPSLAELLQPVVPLSDRHLASHVADDLASLMVADKLADLDIEPDHWDF